MKTLALSIAALVFCYLGFGQQNQYETRMMESINSIKTTNSIEEFQELANQFERIAGAEADKWLPSYYASYCHVMMSFRTREGDQIDQLLDIAQEYLNKAMKIAPAESELLVLQAMLHQGRISVDFMNRGMKYAAKAQEMLEKAKAHNPENPRIYYLMGENIYNTPPFAGGGPEKALPYLKEAKTKFDTFQSESALHPNWGRENNERLLERAEEKVKNN